MAIYGFWNNKGGTGKTSLTFQAACFYASAHPQDSVLTIDMCPQANLSELLLGGLGDGGDNLLSLQSKTPRASIGGYFQMRLPSPYEIPTFSPQDFITTPHDLNGQIPRNLDLVCGDALLELQANAMFTLANTQIPGTNTWLSVVTWLEDFVAPIKDSYRAIFVDSNPSFSLYTQIALATVDELVLPVMADGSSRRALQNAFSLIHGLKLPSPIYAEHNFATRMKSAGRDLPVAKMIVKNRITQYMGDASSYAAVLRSIEDDVAGLLNTNPEIFAFDKLDQGILSVRDFQTAGVVAYARGCPMDRLTAGQKQVQGRSVQVNEQQRRSCVDAINKIVTKL